MERPKNIVTGKMWFTLTLFFTLFDFSSSHCFISDSFIASYSTLISMDAQWESVQKVR